MKKLFVLSINVLFIFLNKLNAQPFNVALIPDSLKENADAVVRLDETNVTIANLHKLVVKSKVAITILNENGDKFANYFGYYDKFRNITDIYGVLYDANGNKVRSIKKKDIADISVSDGFSIASDARAKRFSFYNKTYPYTVYFEDEVENETTYSIPTWLPISAEKLSVQNSSYTIKFPNDYTLNYRQFNYATNADVKNEKDNIIYSWALNNYKAIELETFSPRIETIIPIVFFAPSNFEYGGYKGNMTTWDNYGKFAKQLNEGRDILPENIKSMVHNLADKLPTAYEKVNALYNFLQQNTRYISIQLGVGGIQPFEAKEVAEKKYGDCKALSNYMVSILKEVGIKAYYTLIAAGEESENKVIETFPRDYFNHIITCVPNNKDTIWLECTSQTVSPGYMGSFTGNRKALLITDDGGVLVNTPKYTSKENVQKRKVEASVNAEGNLTATVKTYFTGMLQEEVHGLTHDAKEEIRKKYLNTVISLPTYSVEKFNYKEIRNKIPAMEEELIINSPNYASITGKRLFIVPNLFNRDGKLSNDKPRKFDIDYKRAFTEIDTIHIKIPDGYTIEAMPKNIAITNKFGNYNIQYAFSNNIVSLIRFSERNRGYYPKADYEAFVKFYEEKYKADRGKIVLVKKE